jgi:UDP-2,3-diacylglucosamine pyrophosphatase LpxH
MDAIIVSDLHLGSSVCQAKKIIDFLDLIVKNNLAKELIINGDLFDSWDFRRLKKSHWKILSKIRKMSKTMHVVHIVGNHDGPAEIISHLLGTEVREEYIFESGGKKILCLHGHVFDTFIDKHPRLTKIADNIYRLLMKVDPSFDLARSIKRASKTFMRNSEKIEEQSVKYAKKLGCDIVCAGHVHLAAAKTEIGYFNSGSWTEKPCTYLAVKDGVVSLEVY